VWLAFLLGNSRGASRTTDEVTRDILDGRTDRQKDGRADKAFFSFYCVKNAQQLERSSKLVRQKYEESRRTEKITTILS
jgi:hypothetical protein